ncbi:hypothetical protein MLD63_17815 [Paracoccus sp. TK19116]|uniref:DNA-binding protein n=1 Tax=Paracoccus albicereus TaxID=2922394 RepID=A0ABT1MZH9_9RHOB|nr:hypothetical protein [Paracoccus albicereus]MCQ0972271.1 hypothetical protein [Paracoccus albicereus]
MAISAAKPNDKPEPILTERALAARWHVSVRNLQRRRASGSGPAWLRIGDRVRYRLEDILAFEEDCRVTEATA